MKTIVIASPHKRNSHIEEYLRVSHKDWNIHHITEKSSLSKYKLQTIKPDWVFFPHWSWIIPDEILLSYKCVIFHMTDLPFGRGGSPLQNLIVKGYKKTKISAIECSKELDAGKIYDKADLSLSGTAEDILFRASHIIQDMILNIIKKDLKALPQEGDITNFIRRKPVQSDISNLSEAEKIYDHIRMLDAEGYPNAFIENSNFHISFKEAINLGNSIEAKAIITMKTKDEE